MFSNPFKLYIFLDDLTAPQNYKAPTSGTFTGTNINVIDFRLAVGDKLFSLIKHTNFSTDDIRIVKNNGRSNN